MADFELIDVQRSLAARSRPARSAGLRPARWLLGVSRSLRWRLLFWHALILLVVVVGFGSVLWLQLRRARLDEIDAELTAAARALEGSLRTFPRHILDGGFDAVGPGPARGDRRPPPRFDDDGPGPPDGPFDDRRPDGRPPEEDFRDKPEERPSPDGRADRTRQADGLPIFTVSMLSAMVAADPGNDRNEGPPDRRLGPPPRRPPPEPWPRGLPPDAGLLEVRPPPQREQLQRALELPKSLVERYQDEPAYFVIWLATGKELLASAGASQVPPPPKTGSDVQSRRRGDLREVLLRGPQQTAILVGRPIGPELSALRRLGWQLWITGTGVFILGLSGGWWLSRQAVRPIEQMGATAASITASNLSRRIDLTGVEDELGRLGSILNAMFDRLEASFEQQVRFTADASHELRTPLSVVLSHAELALSRPRAPEQYRESLETCLRASRRMKCLVDDLLTLARADAGKLDLKQQKFNLGLLAQESVSLLQPLADQRSVELSVDAAEIFAVGDPRRIAQVATNLIGNAILYNRPGGRVHVAVGYENAHAVLCVTDNGVGISQADLDQVFERFYRVDKARSPNSGGSGLGLAICKSIVESLHGSIAVASQLDAGSTFVVRLPRAAVAALNSL